MTGFLGWFDPREKKTEKNKKKTLSSQYSPWSQSSESAKIFFVAKDAIAEDQRWRRSRQKVGKTRNQKREKEIRKADDFSSQGPHSLDISIAVSGSSSCSGLPEKWTSLELVLRISECSLVHVLTGSSGFSSETFANLWLARDWAAQWLNLSIRSPWIIWYQEWWKATAQKWRERFFSFLFFFPKPFSSFLHLLLSSTPPLFPLRPLWVSITQVGLKSSFWHLLWIFFLWLLNFFTAKIPLLNFPFDLEHDLSVWPAPHTQFTLARWYYAGRHHIIIMIMIIFCVFVFSKKD